MDKISLSLSLFFKLTTNFQNFLILNGFKPRIFYHWQSFVHSLFVKWLHDDLARWTEEDQMEHRSRILIQTQKFYYNDKLMAI